jgi:hypothetical protein
MEHQAVQSMAQALHTLAHTQVHCCSRHCCCCCSELHLQHIFHILPPSETTALQKKAALVLELLQSFHCCQHHHLQLQQIDLLPVLLHQLQRLLLTVLHLQMKSQSSVHSAT